jgi:hypothetical protein
MAKISRPVLYTAIGAIAIAAFVLTEGEAPKAPSKKPKVKQSGPMAKDRLGFLPEDYEKTPFSPVAFATSNRFQPLVSRTRTSADYALAPDSVPAELAGGDPNWVYTGTAEIDGKPTALLDNRVTGESEFVNQGQRWKRATVSQILPQGLVLATPSGKKVKLTLSNGESTIYPGSPRYASGFQPVNPANLRGPIGGEGFGIRPERPARGSGVEARDAN